VVTVNGATVVSTDIKTKNGVIHVIDTVMMPMADIVDTAVAAGSFKTLAAALGAAGLVDTLKSKGPRLSMALLLLSVLRREL
jgi:transforming growth factor-beta-induced protein